jgi:hypothetical protein
MFLDAIEHVSRISRVLRQPQGSTLPMHQHAVALLATHTERVSQITVGWAAKCSVVHSRSVPVVEGLCLGK